MRILKILLAILMSLFLVFAGASWYLANNYGEIIKKALVEELNERLKSEVKVGQIQVSTWRKIPFFSIEFVDVAILEPKAYSIAPDTLMNFEKVYFQFNLWDIYNGEYKLKRVDIINGEADLKIDKKGRPNFIFWKDIADSSETEFNLALDQLNLKNVAFQYLDNENNQKIHTYGSELKVHGNFSSEKLHLLIRGSLMHTHTQIGNINYLKDDNLQINTGLVLETESNNLLLERGNILINRELDFILSGKIDEKGYSFKVEGNNVTFQKLMRLFPEKYLKDVEEYKARGIMDFEMKLDGLLEKDQRPLIDVSFNMQGAALKHKNYPMEVENIILLGSFSNGSNRSSKSSVLSIDSLSCKFPNGLLKGRFQIRNFEELYLSYSVEGELSLSEIKQIVDLKSLDTLSGKVRLKIGGKQKLGAGFKEQFDTKNLNYNGWVTFSDLKIRMSNGALNFDNVTGKLRAKNKIWTIDSLEGIVQSTKFNLDGTLTNFIPWIYDSANLRVNANVAFDKVVLEDFVLGNSKTQEPKNSSYGPVYLLLNSSINKVSQGKFVAHNIRSTISITPDKLVANPIKFSSMSGAVNGRLSIANKGEHSNFKFQGSVREVDINELFKQFENFGQKEITDKNLKGSANATGRVYGKMVNGQIDPNSIDSRIALEIIDGELNEYKSLIATAEYFRSNLFLKTMFDSKEIEKQFRQIKFDRLQNEIFVSEGKVIIPQMSVSSNFIGFNAEGTHTFDNKIDYHFDFDISDLMAKKREFDTDYGYVSDDGTGRYRVFLKMYGPASNPSIEVDKERKKAHKKNKRKDEKRELKSALKEEFGFFKNDTSIKAKEVEEDFEIEWEEGDQESVGDRTTKTLKTTKSTNAKDKKKGLKKLLQPIEHETEEVDFDDSDY